MQVSIVENIHGYSWSKNLVQEFCNKTLDKRVSSSDWNKDAINELSDKQLEYAANDVIFLQQDKI